MQSGNVCSFEYHNDDICDTKCSLYNNGLETEYISYKLVKVQKAFLTVIIMIHNAFVARHCTVPSDLFQN